MGGFENGPFLGTLNSSCRIIIGVQRGTIILTTTHTGIVCCNLSSLSKCLVYCLL